MTAWAHVADAATFVLDIGPRLGYIPPRIKSRSPRDAFREGIPRDGASAVPAGGTIHSAPGRLRASACRHYDRRARCFAGLGQVFSFFLYFSGAGNARGDAQGLRSPVGAGLQGRTPRPESREAWPGAEPWGRESPWREPRWNAERRAPLRAGLQAGPVRRGEAAPGACEWRHSRARRGQQQMRFSAFRFPRSAA